MSYFTFSLKYLSSTSLDRIWLRSPNRAQRSSLTSITLLGAVFLSIVLSSCEPEIKYQTRDLIVDLNSCVEMLGFEGEMGCNEALDISRDGCFVINNHLGERHQLPIRFTSEGIIPINGEEDLIGDLGFSTEAEGHFSIFLFGQPHYIAPNRCASLRVESPCEGDCKAALFNQSFMLIEAERQLRFSASSCAWSASPQAVLKEVICDHLDNDCDGRIDEVIDLESPDTPQVDDECTRGVGACQVSGSYQCLDGVNQNPTCSAIPHEISDELCDGIDNDCDGDVDEGFVVDEPCEVSRGICLTVGVFACVSARDAEVTPGVEVGDLFCRINDPNPEARAVMLEVGGECNRVDDDCDGFVDEHYDEVLVECGDGACVDEAFVVCNDGVEESLCRDGTPSGEDTTCDGIDDDCDGRADEGYSPQQRLCGVGACKSSGLLVCTNGRTLAFCEPNTPPGVDDDCNGIDDNCNGTPDDNYVEQLSVCGVGACSATGTFTCAAGREVNTCTPGVPTSDQNCNGVDDDCDGRVDEAYTPTPTVCGEGVCRTNGANFCVNGEIVNTCTPTPSQSEVDLCDGFDLDCDGALDEDHILVATTCGRGACESVGEIQCQLGQRIDTCSPETAEVGDLDIICDLIDSDCDGRTDEGYEGEVVSCGVGACSAEGINLCTNGQTNSDTCVETNSGLNDDNCDGIDQDCDGFIDEGYESEPTICGQGICVSTGVMSCSGGVLFDTCSEGVPEVSDALCDRVDSDCDGRFDEDYQVSATTCGIGVCLNSGLRTCNGSGQEVNSCQAGNPIGNDANCDGRDDNCNGNVDENFVGATISCGVGACAAVGAKICVGGQERDACTPGLPRPVDRCDGIDDDCDSLVDEDHLVIETVCGTGACTRTGALTCNAGIEEDTCVPNMPQPDTTCNLIDNDCDGQFDEAFMPMMVTCMNGSCMSAGLELCTLQGLSDTCVETQADDDPTCDGVDDDCDGLFDENYIPPMDNIACGEGVCLNTNGSLYCDGGSLLSMCEEGEPTGEDDDCDGVDQDCDGRVDEEYRRAVECGVGECRRVIEELCVNMMVVPLCEPSSPTSAFDICGENRDDNCDGVITDYSIGQPCTLTQGLCESSGIYVCNASGDGVECNAPDFEISDEVCDAVDNDCDGSLDEEVVYDPSSCTNTSFQGLCAEGSLACLNAQTVCEPSAPTDEIPCNDLDEDCDGQQDEEVLGSGVVIRENTGCSTEGGCKWRCPVSNQPLVCSKASGNTANCPL